MFQLFPRRVLPPLGCGHLVFTEPIKRLLPSVIESSANTRMMASNLCNNCLLTKTLQLVLETKQVALSGDRRHFSEPQKLKSFCSFQAKLERWLAGWPTGRLSNWLAHKLAGRRPAQMDFERASATSDFVCTKWLSATTQLAFASCEQKFIYFGSGLRYLSRNPTAASAAVERRLIWSDNIIAPGRQSLIS